MFTLTNYDGQVKNGIPEGNGVHTYKDGRKYVGQFKNGKPEGPARPKKIAGAIGYPASVNV